MSEFIDYKAIEDKSEPSNDNDVNFIDDRIIDDDEWYKDNNTKQPDKSP